MPTCQVVKILRMLGSRTASEPGEARPSRQPRLRSTEILIKRLFSSVYRLTSTSNKTLLLYRCALATRPARFCALVIASRSRVGVNSVLRSFRGSQIVVIFLDLRRLEQTANLGPAVVLGLLGFALLLLLLDEIELGVIPGKLPEGDEEVAQAKAEPVVLCVEGEQALDEGLYLRPVETGQWWGRFPSRVGVELTAAGC